MSDFDFDKKLSAALHSVEPTEKQKDRMFENILSAAASPSFSKKAVRRSPKLTHHKTAFAIAGGCIIVSGIVASSITAIVLNVNVPKNDIKHTKQTTQNIPITTEFKEENTENTDNTNSNAEKSTESTMTESKTDKTEETRKTEKTKSSRSATYTEFETVIETNAEGEVVKINGESVDTKAKTKTTKALQEDKTTKTTAKKTDKPKETQKAENIKTTAPDVTDKSEKTTKSTAKTKPSTTPATQPQQSQTIYTETSNKSNSGINETTESKPSSDNTESRQHSYTFLDALETPSAVAFKQVICDGVTLNYCGYLSESGFSVDSYQTSVFGSLELNGENSRVYQRNIEVYSVDGFEVRQAIALYFTEDNAWYLYRS